MKKSIQQLFLLLAVAGMGFLASCGDDDEITGPSIEFQEGPNLISMDTTLPGDTTVRFGIDAEKGSFDMENFMVTINDILVMDIPLTGDSTSSFSVQMDTLLPNISEEYDIEASVTDADGRTATAGLIITVVARDTSVMINNIRMLFAPTGDFDSETFYSTNLDTVFSMNDVLNSSESISEDIDFGYAYGDQNGAVLASPSDYPSFVGLGTYQATIDSEWNFQNATEFRTTNFSETEFDAITVFDEETIVDEFEAGTSVGNRINNLQEGQVVAFQTKTNQPGEEKFGLLKVISIEPGEQSNDFIEIQVKVQD